MRRKVLVSVCAAVLLVAAVCSTSFATVILDGPTSVTANGTVEIKIHGTEKGMSGAVTTEGLEFQKVEGGLSDQEMVLLLQDYGGMDATYTYKVTAANGQRVSFMLTDVRESDGQADSYAPDVTWSGTVGGTISTTTGPSPSRTNQPIPTTRASSQASAAASGTTDGAAPAPVITPTPVPGTTVTPVASDGVSPTSVQTDRPRTGDTTVSVWVWIVIGGACLAIGIFAARKVFAARSK